MVPHKHISLHKPALSVLDSGHEAQRATQFRIRKSVGSKKLGLSAGNAIC